MEQAELAEKIIGCALSKGVISASTPHPGVIRITMSEDRAF